MARPATIHRDDSNWPHVELGPEDDRGYFEQLLKAIFQAGLRWSTIESHWPGFAKVFYDFDPARVAAMSERDIERAAHDPAIIRNRRKIEDAVASATAANEVIDEYGSFDAYMRSFDDPDAEIQDLQRRFAGLGQYSAWWFMQSVLPDAATH
jgi:3-methyladenine DNA glycosylase Tag